MKALALNLRLRAEVLGLAHAEVARRAGIAERTYANYVLGRTEPSGDGLVRIADVLQTTIDKLLTGDPSLEGPREVLLARLRSAGSALSDDDLAVVVAQIEAILALRKSQARSEAG